MIKVLLVTRDPLQGSLGGPGKYVPLLFESIKRHYLEGDISASACLGHRAVMFTPGTDVPPGSPEQAAPLSFYQRVKGALRRGFQYASRKTYVVTLLNRGVRNYQWRRQIERVLATERPDLIHCHDFWSVFSLPHSFLVPVILTNHYNGSLYRESVFPNCPELRSPIWARHYRRIEGGAICRARALILPSQSALQLLIDDFKDLEPQIRAKAHVVYTGIEDPLRAGSGLMETPRPESHAVVNVGSHIPVRGLETALRIFAELRRRHPSWRFVNFGLHGSLTHSLRTLSQDLGIAEAVDFRGLRPNAEVLKALLESVLVLHTPVRVVFDLCLLEAMSLGKAVVATNVTGNAEALGTLYPLLVSPQGAALNDHQLAIIDNQQALDALGMTLRRRYLSHFQPRNMAYAHAALWKRLVGATMCKPGRNLRPSPDPTPVEVNHE